MICQSTILPGAPIALLGEAPGQDEEREGHPFVGKAGDELRRMLTESGIDYTQCSVMNVFAERPAGNRIESFCGKKAECGEGYAFPKFSNGKYFLPQHLYHNIERLRRELIAARPTLIIALGNVATWALLGSSGIISLRGSVAECQLSGVPPTKVIPTFHPVSVLREWSQRVICLADFAKALKESAFPEIVRPQREIWIDPTLEDLERFAELYLRNAPKISCDIETGHGQIKCVGFGASPTLALVVPFVDFRNGYSHPHPYSYWSTPKEEKCAWTFVRGILLSGIPLVFQNGLYDIQWLWRKLGLRLNGGMEDTMLMHHALQPELPKDLGFLGSIYTDECSWKLLRKRSGETETTKLED